MNFDGSSINWDALFRNLDFNLDLSSLSPSPHQSNNPAESSEDGTGLNGFNLDDMLAEKRGENQALVRLQTGDGGVGQVSLKFLVSFRSGYHTVWYSDKRQTPSQGPELLDLLCTIFNAVTLEQGNSYHGVPRMVERMSVV